MAIDADGIREALGAPVAPLGAFGRDRLARERLEDVAHAEAGVDEAVLRVAAVDLVAEALDADVDGTVAVALAAAPDPLEQLVAGDDAAALQGERVEDAELGRREVGALAVHVGLDVRRVDAQLLDLDRIAVASLGIREAAAQRRLHAGDELLHRDRLDKIVVGAELEGVHAVV